MLIPLGGIALLVTVCVLSYLAGRSSVLRSEAAELLRKTGLTRNSATLLEETVTFVNSLIRLTKLDGDFGETRLSDKDRRRAEDLVDRYRKETTKA